MIEMYYNGVSSLVNDDIGEVLYLLRKDPTSIKSTQANKNKNSIKCA